MTDAPAYADLELERRALGHAIWYPGLFDAYRTSGLIEEDFFKPIHRWIWLAMSAADQKGESVTVDSVLIELGRMNRLAEVGPAYVYSLIDGMVRPPDDGPLMITARLQELAGTREVAYSLGKPLDEIAAIAERYLTRTADEQRIYDSAGQIAAVKADTARDDSGRVWLGIRGLDRVLDGLRAGEVFGLMARPGIGKTLALCHVSAVNAELGIGHVFFSLEMPAPQIVDRLACAFYNMGRAEFRARLAAELVKVAEYEENFTRFVLVDAPGLSVAQIAAKLRQIQANTLGKTVIRLVTIDHLGLIGGDRKMSTYDRVSTQAREIKELAKRFNCTVLLAVQVNRDQGGDGSKELGLGAARDSGVVEEAMDYLVAMRRLDRSQTLGAIEREKYRDVLFCKVVKNRHGAPDAEVALRIESPSLRLKEEPELVIEEMDLAKIAAMPLRGRR